MSVTFNADPAPYKLCWNCNRALHAGGRAYRKVVSQGAVRFVHARCAEELKREGCAEDVAP